MKYSPKTGGFYCPVTSSQIPDDVIEIDDAHYKALFAAHQKGAILDKSGPGLPILRDGDGNILDHTNLPDRPHFTATPVISLPRQAARALRVASQTMWDKFQIFGESIPDEWTGYTKALRDIRDGKDTESKELPTPPA